ISTSNKSVFKTISVGSYPWGVAITPNGQYVYVANYGGATVSVISTSTNSVISTISVGTNP
ncbi:MAG: YncE family protein, partial [Candidatus Parvarchaeota archaeon]|nr:YncE family protein [Candidatus Parvarchaeota archaeon]